MQQRESRLFEHALGVATAPVRLQCVDLRIAHRGVKKDQMQHASRLLDDRAPCDLSSSGAEDARSRGG
jgi:hypothetical protein